jgi:hypothetical protein
MFGSAISNVNMENAMKDLVKNAKFTRASITKELADVRQNFRSLLLVNPNHFGNVSGEVKASAAKLLKNTTYESIGSVGYQPQLERLHAVVFVNQTSGYGGSLCQNGTQEYVRFYLSYDDGATWIDQGLTAFTAHDIAANKSRLEYAVTLKIGPPRPFCFDPSIIKCRAILSWNFAPPENTPDFHPVWGETHDTNIAIEPRKYIIFDDLLEVSNLKLPTAILNTIDLKQELKTIEHVPHSAADLHKMYDGMVEPHRFAFKEMQSFIASNQTGSSFADGPFLNLDIDWSKYVDIFKATDGNTSYEELECVGYDAQTDTFAGVIRVKKPNGYSGGPCTAGSTEYVTFWGDTDNNGSFDTCFGTAAVRVYDYTKMPNEGLEYSVFIKADLQKYRQPCKQGPRIIPIRAILSWQSAAPANNPDYVPVWGNREETHVLVEPGDMIHPGVLQPIMSSVGSMPTKTTILSSGYANGISLSGFQAQMSPFGGRVDIAGKIVNGTASTKYRILIKPNGASNAAYVPLTNEPNGLTLSVLTPPSVIPVSTTIHADANGYYSYLDIGPQFVDGNYLLKWHTGSAENGKTYDLRLDVSIDGNPANDLNSEVVTIRIDNQAPVADLAFTMGMGVLCSKGSPGMILTGNFTASDENFGGYSFSIYPDDPSLNPKKQEVPSGVSTYKGGTIAGTGTTGDSFTLDTTGMLPCGYALILTVTDRTIVDSSGNPYSSNDSVGFCLA